MRILFLILGVTGCVGSVAQPCNVDRVWLIFERGQAEPYVFIEGQSSCDGSMNLHCELVRELRAFGQGIEDSASGQGHLIDIAGSEHIDRPYGAMNVEKWDLSRHDRMIGTSFYDRKDGELLLVSVYDDYKAVAVQGGQCVNGTAQVRYLLDDVLALSRSDEFGPYLPDLSYGE